MLRNTKHLVQACLLFLALFMITPSANAQFPTAVNQDLQILAYQVNLMASPPAIYTPGFSNAIRVWAKNHDVNQIAVNIGIWVDFNNDGVFAHPAELIYSSPSPTTLPSISVNSGIASHAGNTITMPNLPAPGDAETKIALFHVGDPIVPWGGVIEAKVTGNSSADLALTANMSDDPNCITPADCPWDNLIDVMIGGVPVNAVHETRNMGLVVEETQNPNAMHDYILHRHVVAIDPNTSVPTALPDYQLFPPKQYVPNNIIVNSTGHTEHLSFLYNPPYTQTFMVFYYVKNMAGQEILMKNGNSIVANSSAFRACNIVVCEGQDLRNPNLSEEILEGLKSGELEVELWGGQGGGGEQNGRQSLELLPDEALFFPNPSEGTTFMQLSLEQATTVSWKIRNLQGQTVMSQHAQSAKSGLYNVDLGTQDLTPGLYVCEYTVNGQTKHQRFVKQ